MSKEEGGDLGCGHKRSASPPTKEMMSSQHELLSGKLKDLLNTRLPLGERIRERLSLEAATNDAGVRQWERLVLAMDASVDDPQQFIDKIKYKYKTPHYQAESVYYYFLLQENPTLQEFTDALVEIGERTLTNDIRIAAGAPALPPRARMRPHAVAPAAAAAAVAQPPTHIVITGASAEDWAKSGLTDCPLCEAKPGVVVLGCCQQTSCHACLSKPEVGTRCPFCRATVHQALAPRPKQ